jgi:hypothetical protein
MKLITLTAIGCFIFWLVVALRIRSKGGSDEG